MMSTGTECYTYPKEFLIAPEAGDGIGAVGLELHLTVSTGGGTFWSQEELNSRLPLVA